MNSKVWQIFKFFKQGTPQRIFLKKFMVVKFFGENLAPKKVHCSHSTNNGHSKHGHVE